MTDYLDTIANSEFFLNFKTIENATKNQHMNVGAQGNFTPLVEIEKRTGFRSLKHITPNMKKVAIMFNIEWIEYIGIVSENCQEYNYLKNIEYTVAYDSEFDKQYLDMFICLYNLNVKPVNIIEFSETKKVKVIEKAMAGKKFDIIFSNPPYEKNLHLKILESIFNISEDIIFIHPDNWLINPFREYEKSEKKKQIVKTIGSHIKAIYNLSTENFNAIFGTNNFFGVSIIHYNKNKKDFDTTQFLNKNQVLDKILTRCINLPSFRSKFKGYSDRYTNFVFIRRRTHNYLKWYEENSSKITQGIMFNSMNEKENFIKSLDTWVYEYLNVSEYKLENSAYAPFFGEEINPRTGLKGYEGEWTNEDFYKFFGITKKEQKYIEETISQLKQD